MNKHIFMEQQKKQEKRKKNAVRENMIKLEEKWMMPTLNKNFWIYSDFQFKIHTISV